MHHVYAYGVIAASTLVETISPYPDAGGYAEIAGALSSVGGEAAASALVLARLGIPVKLGGNRLPDDAGSRAALAMLSAAGVDISDIALDPEASPVTEVIITGGDARTIFGTYGALQETASWQPPSRAAIESSQAVVLDPFFGGESVTAARWCLEAGIPCVTVDAPVDSVITQHAAVIVIAEEYASRTMAGLDPEEILTRYAARCEGLTIVTRGAGEGLYARPGAAPARFTPFDVAARDTTGAGDAFRAGVTAALLEGRGDDDAIRVGSALAALVCLTVPGVVNGPSASELASFLDTHP